MTNDFKILAKGPNFIKTAMEEIKKDLVDFTGEPSEIKISGPKKNLARCGVYEVIYYIKINGIVYYAADMFDEIEMQQCSFDACYHHALRTLYIVKPELFNRNGMYIELKDKSF